MKRKTKNVILAVIVSVAATFIPAALFGKWIEAIVFYICHWFIREQFPKQYHHIVHAMCRLITASTLFFGISFVLPLSLSLFSAIPINYFIGWVGFTKKQADYYEVKYEKLRKQLEEKSRFSTDNCTLEQLLERCREIGLSEENTNLAIEFFIKKTKQSEIADKLFINEKSVQMRKQRLKEKLNKI
jgi:hypothetical protein